MCQINIFSFNKSTKRADFKNLEQIFLSQNIQLDLSAAKLNTRQFYTDTQKFSSVLIKIFGEMKKREDFKNIEVTTTQLDDRSIEIKIIPSCFVRFCMTPVVRTRWIHHAYHKIRHN